MFMFGTQAPDWNNVNEAVVSIFRYMMYDYDLYPMRATFPFMANLFFGSFMVLVTNLILWMVRCACSRREW
jgi:Polycystin cation channel